MKGVQKPGLPNGNAPVDAGSGRVKVRASRASPRQVRGYGTNMREARTKCGSSTRRSQQEDLESQEEGERLAEVW